MTEDELKAIEARTEALGEIALELHPKLLLYEDLMSQDIPALIAEVRRLQSVIETMQMGHSHEMHAMAASHD